jgi:hypothetical protein
LYYSTDIIIMQHNNNMIPPFQLLLPPAGPQSGKYGPGVLGSYSHPPGPDPADFSIFSHTTDRVEMQQRQILDEWDNE